MVRLTSRRGIRSLALQTPRARFPLIALPILAALVATGSSVDGFAQVRHDVASTSEPIRIGATLSLTGALATQGTAARNGYLLCQEVLNEAGGLLGRPITLVLEDDASDPAVAAARYEDFITSAEVDLILGPYGSTLTAAVAPVIEALGKVHITPLAATTSIWEQGYTGLFMVLPPAERFLDGLVELAWEDGRKRILVLKEDALFPRAAGGGAVAHAEAMGMTVVDEITYPSGTSDFRFVLEAVRSQQVEVVAMAASALDDFITFRRQMIEEGLGDVWFGTSGAVQEFQDALGPAAEGTYGLSAWEPSLPYPGVEAFTQRYRETFGIAPSFHAAGAFGGCQLLALGIQTAGSLDDGAIRDALLELETTTTFGPFAVDARGYQIAHQGVFIRWEEGEKRVVWPSANLDTEANPTLSTPPLSRHGQVVLVTGATDGLGRALALTLAGEGAHVLVHGRNIARGEEVVAEITAAGMGSGEFLAADFTSLAEVQALADAIQTRTDHLHLLVNNAGVGPGAPDDPRTLTPDGEELRFQVNYLAGYLLTRELLPLLEAAALATGTSSVVLSVTSRNQQPLDFDDLTVTEDYRGSLAYGRSKLAQILHAIDLAEDRGLRGIQTLTVHPAPAMDTGLVRATGGTPQSTVADGLASLEHALRMAHAVPNGTFFFEQEIREPHPQALDPAARARLREASEARIEVILSATSTHPSPPRP